MPRGIGALLQQDCVENPSAMTALDKSAAALLVSSVTAQSCRRSAWTAPQHCWLKLQSDAVHGQRTCSRLGIAQRNVVAWGTFAPVHGEGPESCASGIQPGSSNIGPVGLASFASYSYRGEDTSGVFRLGRGGVQTHASWGAGSAGAHSRGVRRREVHVLWLGGPGLRHHARRHDFW